MRTLSLALLILGCSSGETSTPTTDAAGADTTTSEETASEVATDTGRPVSDAPPSAACITHCECMKANCAMYAGYPYKTDSDCTSHCATFTEPEYKCWSYFCGEAKVRPTNKSHWCQHAWGTWGLEECP